MITVDQTTCKACGTCGTVCPRHIPVTEEGRRAVSPEREGLCMRCGHCVAVCPTGSIAIDGLDPSSFGEMEKLAITDGQLLTLLRQRRSVRRYEDRAVPQELAEQLVEAAHAAPTGAGRPSTCLVVVSQRPVIDQMMTVVYEQYAGLEKALRNPVARLMMRSRLGKAKLATLDDFVMPGMRWYQKWYREGKGDEISRDCPALLLFHGPALEPQVNDNCTIAAFHVILMAETLGLGTCFNHLIPPIVNRSAILRQMLSIPEANEAYTAITLGYPKFKWKRSISRRLAEVRYL